MRPHHKVIVGFLIVLGTSVWALAGSSGADPYLDVHHATTSDDLMERDEVSIKGTVAANRTTIDGDAVRFVILDASGDPTHADAEIPVIYRGVLPDAFGPKMVVVTGALVDGPDGKIIEATDIQVGCSSKY